MKWSLIALGCVLIGFLILLLATRKANSPVVKPCSICGAESRYGYSEHAEEDPAKIKPMCLEHMISKLERDYTSFNGRALVIEPADGPPCYVFQPVEEWHQAFKD